MKSLESYLLENTKEDIYSPDDQDKIADIINKGGYISFEDKLGDIWYNKMSLEDRELTLMLAGFTGFINKDELAESGTFYIPIERDNLLGILEDDITNYTTGYEIDDSTMWIIGYSDNSIKTFSELENDLDVPELDINTSRTKIKNVVKSCINIQKVLFILNTNGYNEPTVWIKNNKGKELFKKFGNFEEWKNGRGEIKRDYIQDDWI